MNERTPKVFLTRELRGAIRGGHPWVFADALRAPAATPAGLVSLWEGGKGGRFVAHGLYEPGSPLAFRALSLDPDERPGPDLVKNRVQGAAEHRRALLDLSQTNAFRLLHGEGDFLPGVVCDLYAGFAVLKYDCEAARLAYDAALVPFLMEGGAGVVLRGVYERAMKGSETGGATRAGEAPPEEVEILERGLRIGVDVIRGQKTGFFLDQRDNRALVESLSGGKRVLNCCSYTGGFTLAAARGGALATVSVDLAPAAVRAVGENLRRNQLDGAQHQAVCADAFVYLSEAVQAGERFDLIVLDPPSFAPSEKARPRALAAYRELNQLGLSALASGGILCSASCSSHITEEDLVGVLREAASKQKRPLRLVERRGAGADHPVLPGFPEGRYLKFLVAR
jgi:23S rRNA (cytosine1962-C5)-methyltransferase